jgi:ferritin
MISKKVADRINLQINRETFSAYLYMAMSAHMSDDGYNGIAKWFMVQYHEEMFHSMKFYQYLIDQGAKPVVEQIEKPVIKAKSIKEFFEAALEHEKFVTASIRELLELAISEKDYATENLVRWYIDEQAEEEKNAVEILRNLELLGDSKQGLFMLNIELGKRAVTIPLDFTAPFPAV